MYETPKINLVSKQDEEGFFHRYWEYNEEDDLEEMKKMQDIVRLSIDIGDKPYVYNYQELYEAILKREK